LSVAQSTRGAPSVASAQAAGSSIQLGITMTTPGPASTKLSGVPAHTSL
jgi:hypothetical protein